MARLLEGEKIGLSRLAGLVGTIFETKVTARERTAGAGLEVPLEPHRLLLVREFEGNDDSPGSVPNGEAGRTAVMPLESFVNVAGDADVMSIRIALASQDVHKPFSDAEHA